MAGPEGFEPPNARTKTWCLTAWRRPITFNSLLIVPQPQIKLHILVATIHHSLYNLHMHKHKGFTIVELLVVVIVIAILVTLGGIGWRTANNNAINSQTSTDLRIIKNAIERYAKDNGEYPFPSGCSGAVGMVAICNNGELTNLLVPRYLEKMPKNHKNRDYPYAVIVKKSTSDPTPGYGLAAEKAEGGECKSGKNMIAGWFGNAPECKF